MAFSYIAAGPHVKVYPAADTLRIENS